MNDFSSYIPLRRERLQKILQVEDLDALVITSVVNVTYLTGFLGDSSVLLLTKTPKPRALLVSDARYSEQIAHECPGLETYIRPVAQKLPEAVAHVLNGLGIRTVGYESANLTVAEFGIWRELAPQMEWKPGTSRVETLRQVKDPAELAETRRAIDLAERAFTVLRALLSRDDREKDLADGLEHAIRRAGGAGTSFPTLVAVNERAALPHAEPGEKRVGAGDLLLVDWGAKTRLGYKSDLTRVLDTRKTPFPPGKLDEIHAIVHRAQQAAFAAIRPGVRAKEVDAAARSVITEAGYGDHFGHGLGHGIGLQIHEAPAIRPLSETILEEGMIFTIEPGIYLPGWGGVRLEDDVLVTSEGCELLTGVPHDLETLRLKD